MNQYRENPNRKVYNVDFDGTLTTGEYTDDPGPQDDVIRHVRSLYVNGNIIIIWTARWWDQAPFLVSWLIKHSVPFHGVIMGKGGSDCYIDDKAMNVDVLKKSIGQTDAGECMVCPSITGDYHET